MRFGVYSDIDLAKLSRQIGSLKARKRRAYKNGILSKPQYKEVMQVAEEIRKFLKK